MCYSYRIRHSISAIVLAIYVLNIHISLKILHLCSSRIDTEKIMLLNQYMEKLCITTFIIISRKV